MVKISKKDEDKFREGMLSYLNKYLSEIQDDKGNWTVKGFGKTTRFEKAAVQEFKRVF